MNNTLIYKGYVGSIEFSETDSVFYGKVLGIRSLISYEGTNAEELIKDFHCAVDDYLEECAAENEQPEISYKGSFNVRIGSDLHRQAAIYALNHSQTLNSFIEDAVREKLSSAKT